MARMEAQQTVWEILMEMERFNGKAKEEGQGAVALAEMAKKVLKEEVENDKEGKNKMIASCGFLEKNCVNSLEKKGTLADSVETLGVDL